MALLIGFALIMLLGIGHHYGMLAIRRVAPGAPQRPNLSIIAVFIGLLALHLAEILAFAGVYHILLEWSSIGTLAGDFDKTWIGLIYFSGINFATLGYTQIETQGPLRLINMMQSLGGFMILTWSATFIYSVSSKAWEK
jgi:hypothetical protein